MNMNYVICVVFILGGIATIKANETKQKLNIRTKRNASAAQLNNHLDMDISGDGNDGEKISENIFPIVEQFETTTEPRRPTTTQYSSQETPTKHKIKRKCTIAVVEYRILKLISRNKIPYERIFPAWNLQPTPKKKIKFLNDTLKDLNLRPLPFCKNDLRLDLTPQKVQSFQPKNATPKTKVSAPTTINPPVCNMEKIRSKVQGYITDGSLSIWTALRIRNANVNNVGKLQLINESLVSANLPPLRPCTPRREDLEENKEYEQTSPALKTVKEEPIITTIATTSTSTQENLPSVDERRKKELQISILIQAGYLPPETLKKFQNGELEEEWIRNNVTRNRKFILTHYPPAIQNLIINNQMPDYIEEVIFSGSSNLTEIKRLIFNDDDVMKAMMPKKISDMLEDRPVPLKLKTLMFSGKNATEMQKELRNDTDLLSEIMSPSMFFFYTLFEVQRNQDINTALSIILICVLTFVMISLGCTMTLGQIGEHARKPKGVLIALFAQFGMMPAAAFGLTRAFNLDVFSSMAVLICGCCPGGNLSNMLAYALNGDMNLSILMTTCSSVVGLGLMPLNIFLYSRFIVSVDSGQIIPFDKIILNIALTIIPVAVGIAIRRYKPQWVNVVMKLGAITLGVGFVLVAVLSGVMFGDAFFIYFPTKVLACCGILPISGYIFGYFFAWVARENNKCRKTICVETGCQNVQLCSTVLKLAFDPVLVGVLFLMPLVYMCFQLIEAVALICGFKLYNRCRGKKKIVEDDSEIKKKSDIESSDEEKKNSETDDTENLLNTQKETAGTDTSKPDENGKPDSWPLDGKPADLYKETMKDAGTEHLF